MLTVDQKRFFEENGFLALDRLVGNETLHRLRQVVEEFEERAQSMTASDRVLDLEPDRVDGKVRVRRIQDPIGNHPLFYQVAAGNSILDVVEGLIGPNIEIWHSKVNMKTGKVGSPVHYHQDFPYHPHTNADLVGVMIMLDDSTPQNGCLKAYPGSHRWGILDHTHEGTFYGMVTSDRPRLEGGTPVHLPVPAGGATIHHSLTVHGSDSNRSGMSRRAFIVEYRAADAIPLIPEGRTWGDLKQLVRGEKPYRARMTFSELPLPRQIPTNLYALQQTYAGDAGLDHHLSQASS